MSNSKTPVPTISDLAILKTTADLAEQGQLPEAEALLHEQLAQDPADPVALLGLGQLAAHAGLVDDAHVILEAALMETRARWPDQGNAPLQAEIQRSKQRANEIQDMMDPGKYQQKDNGKGGYDFYNPKGEKITIDEYSRVTGQNRAKILSDSQDPMDIQFRNDYNNLQDLLQAVVNGDKETVNSYAKQNGIDIARMKPAELINRFKAYYPGYFTTRTDLSRARGGNVMYRPVGQEQAATGWE